MCLAICGSFVSSSTAEVKNYEEKITALEKKIEAQDQKIEEYKKIIYDLDEQVGEIKDNTTPLPVDPYTGY